MNHSCAVIGVAANVTQWTPQRVGQIDRRTDGQTEKFNTISLRFTRDNEANLKPPSVREMYKFKTIRSVIENFQVAQGQRHLDVYWHFSLK